MFFSTLDEVPAKILDQKLKFNHQRIEGIKNIIAISSGRDKVGKNLIAVNIAVTLAQIGSKVGLLNADQNNLNLSKILGVKDPYIPILGEAKEEYFEPIDYFGVKLISITSLMPQDLREDNCDERLNKAIKQVLELVQWGDLDYLIVNLPPGIGKIQITLAQALPFYGFVMITTAQKKTHSDIYETLKMFEQLKVPIIGLVENMSNKIAPDLSKQKYEIRGGEKSKIRVPYLGYIPFDLTVPQYSDRGLPIVLAQPSSIFASALNTIVWAIASQITIARLKS